ncbi:hypothetical protein [Helicobacter pylori]|nr:hypothetical protein [Helicobacter pylori]
MDFELSRISYPLLIHSLFSIAFFFIL